MACLYKADCASRINPTSASPLTYINTPSLHGYTLVSLSQRLTPMNKWLFPICALLLTGCASLQEIAAERQASALSFYRSTCETLFPDLSDESLDACASHYYSQYRSSQTALPAPREYSSDPYNTTLSGDGSNKVYRASECIGAVVNGVCHGSVIDTQPMRQRCYGTMIGGHCTGPQF